jgi:hypothetical protein
MAAQNIVLGVENRLGVTAAGVTDWVLLNNHRSTYPVGISVYHNGSTTAFSAAVEYTFSKDPDTAPVNSVREHKYLKGLSEATAADELDGNFSVPVTAVRLNVASITGGELFISVIQAGV